MENIKTRNLGMHDKAIVPSGMHFTHKNLAFDTIKSTTLSFLGNTAALYGFLKIFEGFETGHWTFKPNNKWQLAIPAGVGALFGVDSGLEKFRNTQVYNSSSDTLNKYSQQPVVLQNILFTTGIPGGQQYEKNRAEKYLRTATTIGIYGFIGTMIAQVRASYPMMERLNTLSNVLLGTTVLCTLGTMGAHAIGMGQWVKKERENISHAERIALERAAAHSTQTSQAK